jgi:hypothetical protein
MTVFFTLAECGTFIRVETSFRALLFGPVLILSNDIRKFTYYKYNLDYNQAKKRACLHSYCLHVESFAYLGIIIAVLFCFCK